MPDDVAPVVPVLLDPVVPLVPDAPLEPPMAPAELPVVPLVPLVPLAPEVPEVPDDPEAPLLGVVVVLLDGVLLLDGLVVLDGLVLLEPLVPLAPDVPAGVLGELDEPGVAELPVLPDVSLPELPEPLPLMPEEPEPLVLPEASELPDVPLAPAALLFDFFDACFLALRFFLTTFGSSELAVLPLAESLLPLVVALLPDDCWAVISFACCSTAAALAGSVLSVTLPEGDAAKA